MTAASENTSSSLLAKLRHRLAQTTDSEPEQAIKIRLSIATALLFYFCLPWKEEETFFSVISSFPSLLALSYFALAFVLAGAIVLNPRPSPTRRLLGTLLDLIPLSILMFSVGEQSVFMFVFYLWVILGMGFRYGINYLYFALVVGVIGFSIALTWGEYWQNSSQNPIALSLLLLLILIPLYSSFLIKKLHAAIAAAKDANEAKSRFLANMSHELRTPLNGVIGIADLMGETKLNHQQSEFVNIMRNSANTLLGLIENVLDISKIEAGKITIAHEPFDLHLLINSIIHMQSPMGEAKGLFISHNINAITPFLLRGDEQHLKQILINLIGNAIKFTNEGSVKLYVTLADKNGEGKSKIRFEIQDTGVGIPEAALPTIFEDFTQARSGQKQTVSGTGLGTTISKELAELMGGEIGVKSELNLGTTFWFELPFTVVPYDDLNLSDTQLLLLATTETTSIISSALKTWDINFDAVHSSARAFSELIKALDNENAYNTLVVDQSCLDITPVQFAQMIKSEDCLENLSLILINTSEYSPHDPELRENFISIIPDVNDRRLLFNAIHASQSISQTDHNVVTLAEHYQAQKNSPALTILIAEDNRVNQQVLEGVLQHAGHKTLTADTGENALDILAEKIDLIDMLILDMNMPEMSGIEVAKALQYIDTSQSIPIIMLTADATIEAKEESLNAGANAFLTKPINSRVLLEQVANLAVTISDVADVDLELDNEATSDWLDSKTINELTLLGGGEIFMNKLVQGFKFDGEKHVAIIKNSAMDDYLSYRESLHALKGSATEMGAIKLAELCAAAEFLKPDDIGKEKLLTLCAQIEEGFEKTISTLQSTITEPVEQTPTR